MESLKSFSLRQDFSKQENTPIENQIVTSITNLIDVLLRSPLNTAKDQGELLGTLKESFAKGD